MKSKYILYCYRDTYYLAKHIEKDRYQDLWSSHPNFALLVNSHGIHTSDVFPFQVSLDTYFTYEELQLLHPEYFI